tara:strand:+ start:921 stop:1439 length:519 start_codon:yes stop_codon:yes gene_type:complete
MAINFANGGSLIAKPYVLQVKHVTYDKASFSGTGYHTVAAVGITPTHTGNSIIIRTDCSLAFEGNHAGALKIQRNINGGSYSDVDSYSDGNRSFAHAGCESNNSDGASHISVSCIDSPNTTQYCVYRLMVGFESGNSNQLIGTSSRSYANSSSKGYPGVYRHLLTVEEVDLT